MTPAPTHLVASPGDRHTICGLRADDGPRVWIEAAPTHRYPHAMCLTCHATLPEYIAQWGTGQDEPCRDCYRAGGVAVVEQLSLLGEG
jgi:hypothetical protein